MRRSVTRGVVDLASVAVADTAICSYWPSDVRPWVEKYEQNPPVVAAA